jgi:glycosyltransferase involved in cell wall biosynthesis|tara:strand:+ start:11155 stop:11778 length:624 start_codon:yes stop_codon:yes gene_type:complete
MKISYAITVCNELNEITHLLNLLIKKKRKQDEIVILFDKKNGTPEVWNRLTELKGDDCCTYHAKTFKHHFADWKNQLTELCSGDYIFQIDADEYPHDSLISQLPIILEANPENDVYLIPRVNTVDGLKDEHIQKWGWRVNDKGWVNWPDYQWRVWKNKPEIKWVNKVHEKLDGHRTYATLPDMEGLSLYHPKKIDRQIKQNEYYNTL